MKELVNKIHSLFTRGKITNSKDDGDLQKIQAKLLQGELKDDLERLQEYGYTSRPLDDLEVLTASLNGNRDHTVVIKAGDRKYRLKNLEKGEVALYTDEGDKIHLKRDNTVEVSTVTLNINATNVVNINTKSANITAEDDCTIQTKTATINASTAASITTGSADIQASGAANIVAGGAASIEGSSISIKAPTTTIDSPAVSVTGMLQCAGLGIGMPGAAGVIATPTVPDVAGATTDLKNKYNSHNHGNNPQNSPTPQA